MSIEFRILGRAGRDNAVAFTVDTGQRQSHLLFDCGGGCLSRLSVSEIRSFDHLFFSHFHMDHVAGFDQFFRCNYNRPDRPVHVWGPPGTIEIMHHRFRGFWWNLHHRQPGIWRVHDIGANEVISAEFRTREAFEIRHDLPKQSGNGFVLDDEDYSVSAIHLEHHGISVGYQVYESDSVNVDPEKLAQTGIRPGPWLEVLKNEKEESLEVAGEQLDLLTLRKELLTKSRGKRFAYLTDFRLSDSDLPEIAEWLEGCNDLVCEAQYREADHELAAQNHHATTRSVGQLATAAKVEQLTLFHLSDRYPAAEWKEMLDEARVEFPKARFPDSWSL